MKILLVGNYENNGQQSMRRYAALLHEGLRAVGHEVRLITPPVIMGRVLRAEHGLGKWLGYIDRYLIFPILLKRHARWADLIHICADAIYIGHVRAKPHLITCHDVLPIKVARGEIAQSRIGWTGRMYQRWFVRNLRSAALICCVSEQTRREAERLAKLPRSRLVVIENALNYPYRPMDGEEATAYIRTLNSQLRSPFFLHVGGNQWYKNRCGVVHLFAELMKHQPFQSHKLVLAGKPWSEDLKHLVHSLRLQNDVIEIISPSDAGLNALYSKAEALLFPSLEEGFGWPVIEAQACGCPVVTTNKAPMTEVGGRAAIYIDPHDVKHAALRIVGALCDPGRWRREGLKNASRFMPSKMIEGYVQCYLRVADGLAA